MAKVVDYKILSEILAGSAVQTDSAAHQLARKVKAEIANGWTPLGSPQVAPNGTHSDSLVIIQAMVKE